MLYRCDERRIIGKYPDAVHELVNSFVKSGTFIENNPDEAAKIGAKFLDQKLRWSNGIEEQACFYWGIVSISGTTGSNAELSDESYTGNDEQN
jgi:ABC-type nitrate/sulfonate/bicarbonate transport system substrate-binding protein